MRRLVAVCLLLSLCGLPGWSHAFDLLPHSTSKSGYPTPKGAPWSAAEMDSNFFAAVAGALSRGSTQTLAAGTQIDCQSDAIIPVVGSGGPVTLTGNPQILAPVDLPAPKLCILEGTSATNTVTISDGNGVELRYTSSVTLGLEDTLWLVYNGSKWVSQGGKGVGHGTAFPPNPGDYDVFIVVDDSASGVCDSNAGSAVSLCYWDPVGEGWEPLGGGGGGSASTLDEAFDGGKSIDGANSHSNAFRVGNGTWFWDYYVDGTNAGFRRFCNAAQSTCVTAGVKAETGSDLAFVNENGTTCWTFDSVTGAYASTGSGTCVNNLLSASDTATLTNKTLDVEATGNSLTTVHVMEFPFATCIGGVAARNWDDSATLTEPAASCNTGSNRVHPTADFDAAADEGVAISFVLPTGVVLGNIDLTLYWHAAATSGAVNWCYQMSCVATGETVDPSLTSVACVSDTAAGTTLQRNEASFSDITTTGCAAGERFTLQIRRDGDGSSGTDSMTGDALAETLVMTLRRTQ